MTPAEALAALVARVSPFDDAADPVTPVTVDGQQFHLTPRVARAFAEALARWTDPDDHGRCPDCGGLLDRHLRCAGCGRVDGIFGATVAGHAARHRA